MTSCERMQFGADVRCRPLMKLSGTDDRHPCLTARAIRAVVASEARPPALTTGGEVTSVTWAAACALHILWLGYPRPGASRDVTPGLGRAVVTDQWQGYVIQNTVLYIININTYNTQYKASSSV
jgi:hypothetical protein